MSNVQLVRSSPEAFGRGDPDVEWQLADPWTDGFGPAIEFDDFIDCGDWVVAPWSGQVHGHGSGIEIEISETYAGGGCPGRGRRMRTGPAGRRSRFSREEWCVCGL